MVAVSRVGKVVSLSWVRISSRVRQGVLEYMMRSCEWTFYLCTIFSIVLITEMIARFSLRSCGRRHCLAELRKFCALCELFIFLLYLFFYVTLVGPSESQHQVPQSKFKSRGPFF